MKIQKLNIFKEIPDKAFPEYERMGYSRLDASGKMVKSKSKEEKEKIAELEKMLAEKGNIVTSQDNKIAELEKELRELKGDK